MGRQIFFEQDRGPPSGQTPFGFKRRKRPIQRLAGDADLCCDVLKLTLDGDAAIVHTQSQILKNALPRRADVTQFQAQPKCGAPQLDGSYIAN
jgi:hypothetical protein